MSQKKILNILAFITAMALLAGSCTKEAISQPPPVKCASCYLISYKYTSDWVMFRIDTLWKDRNICGDELVKVETAKQTDTLDFRNCPPPWPDMPYFRLEIQKYFVYYY